MSLRRSRPRDSEGLPVFQIGMNSSTVGRGCGGRRAEDIAGERTKVISTESREQRVESRAQRETNGGKLNRLEQLRICAHVGELWGWEL